MTKELPALGETISSAPKRMTRERMRWYCDTLETAARGDGTFVVAEPTIHSDDDFAAAQGLPGIIADGMLSTNYLSSLLYRTYGLSYLTDGELDTKFIRPVYEDETVRAFATVTADDGENVALDVWCEADGNTCTVGSARVRRGAAR